MAELCALEPDYLLVIGWSQLIKSELLQLPRRGAIGFHPALLPENRGRAALPWVILRGLKRTGVSLFFLDEGMDSGDIICQQEIEVAPDETARTLYNKVSAAEQSLMRQIAPWIMQGKLLRRAQDHSQATYTAKRTARDGLIDWQQSAHQIWTLIRAVSDPYPGAFTFYRGRKLTIWSADLVSCANYVGVPGQVLRPEEDGVLVQCGAGHIRLRTVQEEGQAMRPAADYFTRVHDVLGIDWLALYEQMQNLK
ncbi:MAG: methionyl-tRNA formyltransferase [Caldilineaceae bacterium]